MLKPSQPRIKAKRDTTDLVLEITGLVAVLVLFVLPAYYYPELPEEIPVHYGFGGTPDRFGNRATIWIMPALGLVIYTGLALLSRYPHIFNYPVKITPENAENQYKKATRFIRLLNAIIAVSFAYITYSTIMTAKGEKAGMGNYFSPVLIILIITVMGGYLFRSYKKKTR